MTLPMETADAELDITGERCPMTFVRTRLALDRLQSGQMLLVRLRGEEVRRNLPRSAALQGHVVHWLHEAPGAVETLLIRKR